MLVKMQLFNICLNVKKSIMSKAKSFLLWKIFKRKKNLLLVASIREFCYQNCRIYRERNQ